MSSRLVTVAFLLALVVAVPVGASAGECQYVLFAFEGNKDSIEIVNLDSAAHTVTLVFYLNNGTVLGDSALPSLASGARGRVFAKQVYATFSPAAAAGYADTYVRMRLGLGLTFPPFAAILTSGGETRELGCISPPS